MGKRVLIAGFLGGIALFMWGFVSHMLTGLGSVGIKEIPHEQEVVDAMGTFIHEPGFYFFPGLGLPDNATRAQKEDAMKIQNAKAASAPAGILIFHPNGGMEFSAAKLINEFLLNLVQAFLLAILLAWAFPMAGYLDRVRFVTVVGIFGAIATNVQYWNWYGFPTSYTVTYIAMEAIGFFVTGLVVGALVKRA
jgi:hypothetical protein